jgi:putative DNA-invertase from lambdoid prophage Rac
VTTARTVTEMVSGSVAAMERKGFVKLVDRLEAGDVLIVAKLDRSYLMRWTCALRLSV